VKGELWSAVGTWADYSNLPLLLISTPKRGATLQNGLSDPNAMFSTSSPLMIHLSKLS
jgi:hypothetical protein